MTCIGVSGCMKADKMADITVTIGQENIKSIALKNNRNNLSDNKNIFKFAFEQEASSDIKYIKIGEKIALDFGNNHPDKMIIKEILLNSNGENLYGDETIVGVPFKRENNKYVFIVEKNPASFLSSVKKKTEFRGYKIIAYFGEIEYVYAFVIETDAF